MRMKLASSTTRTFLAILFVSPDLVDRTCIYNIHARVKRNAAVVQFEDLVQEIGCLRRNLHYETHAGPPMRRQTTGMEQTVPYG
jgi:hypothetical protein